MNELENAALPEETVNPTQKATENAVIEENIVNYHALSKDEINARMREIIEQEIMDAHKEVAALKQAFFNLRSREQLEEVNAFIEAGNNVADFSSSIDESESEFKRNYSLFKDRRAAYLEIVEQQRQKNLDEKLEIIEKIKSIVEDIDNINMRFAEFQQLQQDFKEDKELPPTSETDVWKSFQITIEQFYDNLKVNKELRDLDFKKNLEAKRAIIESAKSLVVETDPIASFRKLQGLHADWRNIGPVAKELREALWEEFKEISTIINRRHQEYFEERKAKEKEYEDAKTSICEEIEKIDLSTLTTFAQWTEATEKVIELQKSWKELGFTARKVNNLLYNRFRKACDEFFSNKAEYFKKYKEETSENLSRKTALCEKAEALKTEEDKGAAVQEIKKLQAEWKTIGGVSRKQNEALWQRFQTACNEIFEERKKIANSRKEEEIANMELKNSIVAQMKELPLDGVRQEVMPKIKELQAEWMKVGYVPIKHKERLYKEFRAISDELYGAYAAKENRARMNNFKEKVRDMKNDDKSRERDRLRRALENKKTELKTVENNIGFFSVKSNSGNSLLRDMENKIKRLKEDMSQIQEKIDLLDK